MEIQYVEKVVSGLHSALANGLGSWWNRPSLRWRFHKSSTRTLWLSSSSLMYPMFGSLELRRLAFGPKEKIVEVPTVEVREVIKQVSKPEAAHFLLVLGFGRKS